MASIVSSGIGSGLDVNGIISKLMTIESQPLKQLATKEASYQAKLSAFGSLKGAFASLQSAARALKSATLFTGMSATPSDTSIMAASANMAATPATYAIDVTKIAKGQTIASGVFTSLTDDIITAGGDGKLKITLGSVSGGVFTDDPDKTPVTIDIPQTASSLNEVRDAINNAGAGVTARIINVGVDALGEDQYKLMVSANGTGAKTSLKIEALDSSGSTPAPTGLEKFEYNAATDVVGGFDQTVGAQDAEVEINSLKITRSTNTISDAITGVTMTLAKEGATSLTIAKNTSAVSTALETFVEAYNTANEQVRQLTAYNAETQQAAILQGDSGARALQSALREMVGFNVTTDSANIRSLSNIGITMQRDGSLELNTAKLASALRDEPDAVEQLVTSGNQGTSGVATRMSTMLDNILNETSGILASRTDGIDRSIAEIEKRRETLIRRLEQIEARYRKQFSALDAMMSSMTSTSQYLTQQFAALNKG